MPAGNVPLPRDASHPSAMSQETGFGRSASLEVSLIGETNMRNLKCHKPNNAECQDRDANSRLSSHLNFSCVYYPLFVAAPSSIFLTNNFTNLAAIMRGEVSYYPCPLPDPCGTTHARIVI